MKRKWNWDFEFFSKRTPEVAYWAGFMMADGGLNRAGKNSWTLAFILTEKDLDHLKRFCDAVGLSHDAIFENKTYNKREPSFGVHLVAMNLGDDLKPWGIIPRKSYNFIEPDVLIDLLPHYLRGWADGDGQIYVSGRAARFTVSGNGKALRWYAEQLKRLGYSGGISFQDRNEYTSILYIGGKDQVSKIMEFVDYKNDLKLNRKWNVHRDDQRTLFDVVCENCGKHFGVPKFRYDHPTYGRFCSRKCASDAQKKEVQDDQMQCAKCGEWKSIDDFSGNKSYCKECWREIARERRRAKGVKEQQRREYKEINGISHRKCPRCSKFKPSEEFGTRTYCKSCHAEYMREYREGRN